MIVSKFIDALKAFLIIFVSVHIINLVLLVLVMGFWDGGLSFGFPKAFYVINCGFIPNSNECPTGFNFYGLILDLLFWYILAIIIKTFRKTGNTKN